MGSALELASWKGYEPPVEPHWISLFPRSPLRVHRTPKGPAGSLRWGLSLQVVPRKGQQIPNMEWAAGSGQGRTATARCPHLGWVWLLQVLECEAPAQACGSQWGLCTGQVALATALDRSPTGGAAVMNPQGQ